MWSSALGLGERHDVGTGRKRREKKTIMWSRMLGLGERDVRKRLYHVEQGVGTGRKIRDKKTIMWSRVLGLGERDWVMRPRGAFSGQASLLYIQVLTGSEPKLRAPPLALLACSSTTASDRRALYTCM
ncbi:hypothetical protein RRG08_037338 [Elysia crispata]|uniref:Uncharacterized protein n=1 Tax=Elysia crispata TaxID=231223 RepID=A0AAE1AH87_9GAST|nr:hypothetical protein RRG08_037338 [Elysia crispata]